MSRKEKQQEERICIAIIRAGKELEIDRKEEGKMREREKIAKIVYCCCFRCCYNN